MPDTSPTPPTLTPPAPWTPPNPLPNRMETDRLVLRFWEHGDAQALFEMTASNRESFLPWLPWARDDHRCVEESTYFIEKAIRERRDAPGTNYTIGIFDRATGLPLGGTGIHRIEAKWHEGEIGYFVRGDRRNQGICTESTRAMLTWTLRPQSEGGWGLRRMHIRCAGQNHASQRVPRKLGLREEARLVQERWVEGIGWDDTLVWGVLAEEWSDRS